MSSRSYLAWMVSEALPRSRKYATVSGGKGSTRETLTAVASSLAPYAHAPSTASARLTPSRPAMSGVVAATPDTFAVARVVKVRPAPPWRRVEGVAVVAAQLPDGAAVAEQACAPPFLGRLREPQVAVTRLLAGRPRTTRCAS